MMTGGRAMGDDTQDMIFQTDPYIACRYSTAEKLNWVHINFVVICRCQSWRRLVHRSRHFNVKKDYVFCRLLTHSVADLQSARMHTFFSRIILVSERVLRRRQNTV